MSAQAVQTKEHEEEQDGVGNKSDNGAESDTVQVEHTAFWDAVYAKWGAELRSINSVGSNK